MDRLSHRDVVELVLEAALDDSLWNDIADKLRQRVNGNRSLLFTPRTSLSDTQSLWATQTISRDELRPYTSYYCERDIWEIEGRKRGLLRSGRVLTGQETVDESTFRDSEWFNDYLRPLDIKNLITAGFDRNPSNDGSPDFYLSIYGSISSEPFSRDAREAYKQLVPHIQNGLHLRGKFLALKARKRTIEGLLNSLSTAALLIDESGRVIENNRAADSLLTNSRSLTLLRGRLVARSASEQQNLRRAIVAATRTACASGDYDVTAGSVYISRANSSSPYRVSIHPLPRTRYSFSRVAAAVVYILDPEGSCVNDLTGLTAFFGLQPSEMELCRQLVSGKSLLEAADTLAITQGTARQRLKAIFRKTDTHSQSSLLRLILTYRH